MWNNYSNSKSILFSSLLARVASVFYSSFCLLAARKLGHLALLSPFFARPKSEQCFKPAEIPTETRATRANSLLNDNGGFHECFDWSYLPFRAFFMQINFPSSLKHTYNKPISGSLLWNTKNPFGFTSILVKDSIKLACFVFTVSCTPVDLYSYLRRREETGAEITKKLFNTDTERSGIIICITVTETMWNLVSWWSRQLYVIQSCL